MKLFIKNMVCNRCILVVKQELDKLNLIYSSVKMGEISIEKPSEKTLEILSNNLSSQGFEILDNRESKLIEKIKIALTKLLSADNEGKNAIKLSQYLSTILNNDYNYLSSIFSENQGRTLENYFIQLRIEKVKELLIYNQLTLSEISYKLGYSSVSHLSGQFKKVTGLTPSYFKNVKDVKKRNPIDNV